MIPSYSTAELSTSSSVSAYYSQAPQGSMQHSLIVRGDRISQGALKVIAKLQSFHRLNENWDSYNAARPSPTAIDGAITFVDKLDRAGFSVYFTGPGPDGEILVEVRRGDCSVEVSFNDDSSVEYVVFQGALPAGEGDNEPSVPQLSAMLRAGG